MIITTGNEVAGYSIEAYLGVVRGLVVRSSSTGLGWSGGNIETFALVCDEARQQAFERMMMHAGELGAHAIIAMRYEATEFMAGMIEVLAYGTAVTLRT